ncbi:Fbox domain containing protein, partial [Acanthamoeba castellanii str. Neff]
MGSLSHALDGHNPMQPLRSTSPSSSSSSSPSSGAAAYVNKVIPLETTFTLSVGVAFFIYAKLLLAELRLHCAAAHKDPFSAAQYFNPDYFGYAAAFLFNALLPRKGPTDDQLLSQLSRFVAEHNHHHGASSSSEPTRLDVAEFNRFYVRHVSVPSLYLPVDPLEALGRSIGSAVLERLDVYSLIRAGQVCRAWRELSLQDRLWANDYYRQPPLRQTSASATLRHYQPSTHRGRAFRDICYSIYLD